MNSRKAIGRFACFGALALAACLGGTNVYAAGYGAIEGQFVLDGTVPERGIIVTKGDATVKDADTCAKDNLLADDLVVDPETKGIANVFIYMTSADAKKIKLPPDLVKSAQKELVFDQKGCRFEPHAMTVRTDQSVVVKSGDPIAHNTHTYTIKNKGENLLIAANDRTGTKIEPKKAETLPMEVKCDIHGWMKAYWLIQDHPYMAVTDSQGKFKIEGLPEGKHEFRVWHERGGYLDRKYTATVKADGTTTLEAVKVPVAKLKAK